MFINVYTVARVPVHLYYTRSLQYCINYTSIIIIMENTHQVQRRVHEQSEPLLEFHSFFILIFMQNVSVGTVMQYQCYWHLHLVSLYGQQSTLFGS